jgi:hypothetical protein
MVCGEMRSIRRIRYMGGREKDEKEGAKDNEEEEDAKLRAVKDGGKGPSWKECEHEGEMRGEVAKCGLVD